MIRNKKRKMLLKNNKKSLRVHLLYIHTYFSNVFLLVEKKEITVARSTCHDLSEYLGHKILYQATF